MLERGNMIIDDNGNVLQVPKTICTECKHYFNLEPYSARSICDYNRLCKANPLPQVIDPIDGKLKYVGRNDLGGFVSCESGEGYQQCRKCNDGDCPKFDSNAL